MLVAIFGSSQSTSGQFLISLSSRGNVSARETYLARGCVSLCEGVIARERENYLARGCVSLWEGVLARERENYLARGCVSLCEAVLARAYAPSTNQKLRTTVKTRE